MTISKATVDMTVRGILILDSPYGRVPLDFKT